MTGRLLHRQCAYVELTCGAVMLVVCALELAIDGHLGFWWSPFLGILAIIVGVRHLARAAPSSIASSAPKRSD